MLSIMLIDDDIPMLDYVEHLLQVLDLKLELVAKACTSEQALEQFHAKLPDLVVTDIGMPGMDGLELAREFKQAKPDVRLIFLTCYEDFYYSKKAFQLEADDYLIKDELSSDQLLVSINKALKQLESRRELQEGTSLRHDIVRNKDLLKQSFLKELLQGSGSLTDTIEFGRRLGIVWKWPAYRQGFIHIDSSSVIQHYRYGDMDLLCYAVYNIALELSLEAAPGMSITPIMHRDCGIFVLWNVPDQKSESSPASRVRRQVPAEMIGFMKAVQDKAEWFLKVNVRGFCSPAVGSLEEIGALHKAMLKSLDQSFYQTADAVIVLDGQEQFRQPDEGRCEKERVMLARAFAENNASWIDLAINALLQNAAAERLLPRWVKETCADFVRNAASEAGGHVEEGFYGHLKLALRADEAACLAKRELRNLLRQQSMAPASAVAKDPRLQTIDQFLERHPDEMVTSVDMAEHLHLNPSYFSRFFKRLAGVNFTEYVNQFKINMAIQMLQRKDETVENVAYTLGFSDRAYFSKVFKKYSGKSPSEFKGMDK